MRERIRGFGFQKSKSENKSGRFVLISTMSILHQVRLHIIMFRILIVAIVAIALSVIVRELYHLNDKDKLASMIRDGDAAGVSRLIASYPNLVNASIDSRTWLKPLDLAASLGQVVICSNLIAAGANVNDQDIAGETPLYFAFGGTQNVGILDMLLQHGADVALTNINGDGPLYWAVIAGNTNAVVMLLKHGANPTLKDRYGKTPLDHAKESVKMTNEYIINILSEAPSNPWLQ